MASYHTPASSSPLTKAEREVVLTIADDEQRWAIYTDSRRLGGKLRKLVARWGVEPVRTGYGWSFTLPLRAIRLAGPPRPLTEADLAQRRRAAAASRNAQNSSGDRGQPRVLSGSAASDGC